MVLKIALFFVALADATGQVTFLTVPEAMRIVSADPRFSAARERGECPTLYVTFDSPRMLGIQARGSCRQAGDASSLLIANYSIDRRTGSVDIELSGTTDLLAKMRALSANLVAQAQSRLLSINEARCLAVRADTSLTDRDRGWVQREIRVRDNAPARSVTVEFTHSLDAGRLRTGRALTVDRDSGQVMENDSGREVASAEVAALRAQILQLRAPIMISTDQAIEIARCVRQIRDLASDPCSELESWGDGTASDVYIVRRQPCKTKAMVDSEIVAAVNRENGAVWDPRSNKQLQSDEASSLALAILTRLRLERQVHVNNLEKTCGLVNGPPRMVVNE